VFTRPDLPRFRVGVDIVQVRRVARLIAENPGIVDVVFTRRESEYCLGKRRCHEHLAARFVAKEAVLKAFGTGLGPRMRWTEVEIVHDTAGRPRVCLHGEVADWARRHGLSDLDVSLSHTADLAIAHALVSWDAGPERLEASREGDCAVPSD
jgi:holo-[acyl-carrier protein] synthase